MKYFTFSLSLLFLFSFVSCSQSEKDQEPKVTVPISENQWVRAEIGDSQLGFQVLGTQSLLDAIKSQQVRAVGNTRLRKKSLTVAFPKKLLNEHFIFGGVITQVSDSKSALLGGLKLSDLPPISVRPKLTAQETDFKMELKGCLQNCDELSPQTSVVDFPIVGIDEANDRVILDLAVLGDQLNLVKMLDPNGEYTQLKTKTSEVVAVDYSASTLVFDVRVLMVPLNPKEGEIVSETQFTVRWYLRLNSVFNPSFVARDKTEGVGFFMTERGRFPKIIRHALTNYSLGNSQGEIKYFLKNIPQEHQESFKAAFDAWNEKFSEVAGRPLIRYEFIDALDPRSKNLVAGDVRYNILEWDLENEASYGGLGPSIANQFTGEILSSNVLIQGPRIVEIYQNWFKASKTIEQLKSQGQNAEAERELKKFLISTGSSNPELRNSKLQLSLGGKAGFKIHSQSQPYEDPIFLKEEFEVIPVGVSYEKYMKGYFMDMVAHELGHNLGLRHNFKGNLAASEGEPMQGKVSSSIMEYLGRPFRYLDEIGSYDVEAIKYGYLGILPVNRDNFCTDEDVPDSDSAKLSAECSRDDATSDPFGYFLSRLNRAVNLVIARGMHEAPAWQAAEMATIMEPTVRGLAFYRTSAESTGSQWKQFFNKPGRPQEFQQISSFVTSEVERILSPSDLEDVFKSKNEEDSLKARMGYIEFKERVLKFLKDIAT